MVNRLDDALTYFQRELTSNPQNGLAYYYIGEVYYRKADFSKALDNYQKAIEKEPDNASYHLGAGTAYLAAGQTDKAIEQFQIVINTAVGTYEAEQAKQRLAKVNSVLRDKEIVEKWQNAQKNVQVEKVVEEQPEKSPAELALVQTVSVDALVKDVRFGPETKRKEASRFLYNFSASQLEPFLSQFISHMDKEKNEEVRKNLLLVIGKTQTQQAVDYLFNVLESPDYLFDTKMVALVGLSETLRPDAAEKLKNILDKMVSSKLKMREEAKDKIEAIEKKIDDLESQKFVIRNDIAKVQSQRQTIYNKLNMQPAFEEGAALPPGIAPPEVPGAEKPVEILTPEQIKQLRAQLRTLENDINTREARIARLEKQIETLKSEKTKYEQLLVKRYSTGAVKVLGVERRSSVETPEQASFGAPPEMPIPQPSAQPSFVQTGPEEQQEQSLALSIIKILGRIGNPDHLFVIEKAWEEYKAASFELDYGLVRAQLGSYEYIEKLVSRLQEDYPSDPSETYFRAEIVKVVGNYLSKHENQDYAELLSYLAESDPNQVVKVAANQALSKIKTKEPEKPARKT
ncbi:MAG: tetratricopeptide repeat protein, partial [Candidatus Omnitrophica bacterium]|nr:tetratricopeptide repeat protein [Candidatus Omnitrophota bacterium]